MPLPVRGRGGSPAVDTAEDGPRERPLPTRTRANRGRRIPPPLVSVDRREGQVHERVLDRAQVPFREFGRQKGRVDEA
ncbi:hypothetical protein GCM10009551_044020 [Nocardiopsis tropica]